jgi:transposase
MEIERDGEIPQYKRIQAATRMNTRARNQETAVGIAQDLEISRSQLYELQSKSIQDPTMADRQRSGRRKKVDEHLERRIIRSIQYDPFQSSQEIANAVNVGLEEENQISASTVRNVAHAAGYKAYRPLPKPPLEQHHVDDRLHFAERYEDRTMHFWRNCIFMDETFVRLHPKDSRERVWRQVGERLEPEHLVPSVKYGGGGVMFWGCVTWGGVGPLIPIDGVLDGGVYADLLMDNLPLLMDSLGMRSAYIIQDGARVHETYDVISVKEILGLRDLELPPYSPDANIIENLWGILKTRVAERNPGSLEELVDVTVEEWNNISLEEVRTIFYSIPDRLHGIVTRGGGHTKY